MSGSLNFSVLLDVARAKGYTDFDDIMFYANEMENLLSKKREANKPKK